MNERPITFHVRVRDLRKEQDLTQERLADILGISRQSVISLESGKCLPSLPIALQLAELFAVPLENIFLLDETRLASSIPGVSISPVTALSLYPPVNLFYHKNSLVLQVNVAGYNKEAIDVEVDKTSVSINGRPTAVTEDRYYLAYEFVPVEFHRAITLPEMVDTDRSTAKISAGLLTVTMPVITTDTSKKKLNIS